MKQILIEILRTLEKIEKKLPEPTTIQIQIPDHPDSTTIPSILPSPCPHSTVDYRTDGLYCKDCGMKRSI